MFRARRDEFITAHLPLRIDALSLAGRLRLRQSGSDGGDRASAEGTASRSRRRSYRGQIGKHRLPVDVEIELPNLPRLSSWQPLRPCYDTGRKIPMVLRASGASKSLNHDMGLASFATLGQDRISRPAISSGARDLRRNRPIAESLAHSSQAASATMFPDSLSPGERQGRPHAKPNIETASF